MGCTGDLSELALMAGEYVVGAGKPYDHSFLILFCPMLLSDERGELDASSASPLNSFDSLSDENKTASAPFLF